MSEYLDFLEACEYEELANLATEQETAQLVRDCREYVFFIVKSCFLLLDMLIEQTCYCVGNV